MRRISQAVLVFWIANLLAAPVRADRGDTPSSRPTPHFAAGAYLEHVKYLASDELGGRGTGSRGNDLAAEYIAKQFQAAGCEPGGVDGTWFQPFEVRAGKKIVDEDAGLEIDGLEHSVKIRQDWIPLPFSDLGEIDAPLAFAGYGIAAERENYDDYQDFEADGKALLIFRFEPRSDDPEARFGGQTPSRHATFQQKARVAARHGAKALLIVNPPNRDPEKDELYAFSSEASQQTHAVVLIHIVRPLAEAILKKAGQPDLKTLCEQLGPERKPLSHDLGLRIKLHTGLKPNVIAARNVIARIPGAGETQETIVLGAHYDHLGTHATVVPPSASQPAQTREEIHNGADDNASGTAGVIELARALKSGPPLRRNVLCMTFGGEEMGLLGSYHFVAHPTIPLENIKAMVNLDMIGRLSLKKFTVYGSSSAEEFPPLIKVAAAEADLTYQAPLREGGFSGASDHASFARHNIPVLFLFTGMHKEYHQPEDDWELIDADGAARILQMTHRLVVELANMEHGPEFTRPARETGPEDTEPVPRPAVDEQKKAVEQGEVGPADPSDAEKPRESDEPPSRGNLRVRLGIIPDMAGDEQPGMVVQGVLDGGAAQKAGIRENDRIVKIGDEEIRDIYGYMRVLQSFKPGDTVVVVVVRGEERKTLTVKLESSNYKKPDN